MMDEQQRVERERQRVQQMSMGQMSSQTATEFRLIPIRQDSETPDPKPTPTTHQRPALEAIDRQVLETLDDHAIQVSKSDHKTFKDLVWDLIYSQNITNEIEKVRVIFRWLASKNLKEMNFDHVEERSPEEVLMGLKTGKTTYANVIDTMCNYGGLHSKIISGYAKGTGYRLGEKFKAGSNQHSWNAVYINGTWCLIDAHWAAKRTVGKQAASEEFNYELEEYYFLTDPHQLIYTHFPDDANWQLLERLVTLEEFENMPHMKSQFFQYGLEFVTNKTAVIHSHSEVNIQLRYKQHKLAVAFNFKVSFEDGEEEYSGIKLSRYGMQESTGDIASFKLRPPVKGSYILSIYAKEDIPEKNMFGQVCEYKIIQQEIPSPAFEPFPPCSYTTWGPGSAFFRYGLTASTNTATLTPRDGKIELQICFPKPMQFMGKLKHNKIDDAELEAYITKRVEGKTAFFNITTPMSGEYGLEIYANDPSTEGTSLRHIAQYLIQYHGDAVATPLPKLPPGYLGAQSKFQEFCLCTASHNDPVIHLECNTCTINIRAENVFKFTANLISCDNDKKYSEYVFLQTMGSMMQFIVNLPSPGFYKLELYAILASDKSQQLPGVYNYLINCQKMTQDVSPFPKQYTLWKDGCYMKEPGIIQTPKTSTGQQIPLKMLPSTVNFCATIPRAKAVAIVSGEKWTHLNRLQGDEWSGTFEVAPYYGTDTKITLNANYGGESSSFSTLLEYVV